MSGPALPSSLFDGGAESCAQFCNPVHVYSSLRSPGGLPSKEQQIADPYFPNDFSDCWFGPNNEPLGQDGWQDSDQTGTEAAILIGGEGCMDFGAHLQKNLRKHRFSLDQEDIEPLLEEDQPDYSDAPGSDSEEEQAQKTHIAQRPAPASPKEPRDAEAAPPRPGAPQKHLCAPLARPAPPPRLSGRPGAPGQPGTRAGFRPAAPVPAALGRLPGDCEPGRKPQKKVLLEWMSAVERRPHAPPRPKPPAAAEGRGAGLLAKKARRFEQRATGKRRSASSSRERPAPKRQRTGSQLTSVRSNAYFAKALSKAEKLVRYWKDPSKQIPIVFKALTKSHESDTNLKQEIDLSNRKLMMAESPPINEATRDKSLARHGNNKKTKVVPAQQKHKKSNR